jgi:ABC-type cobalamin/Fe3+-siderophores transport system ATPase subunit
MAVQFDTISSIPNGANFFTADLHIHTFGCSPCVKDEAMTIENIIETAVKRKLAIIAITDHNDIKNIELAVDYGRKFTGNLLVVPGAEITTSNGHLLIYFPAEKIANLKKMMALLDIVNPGTQESHTQKSMAEVIYDTEKLGGVCIAAHIDRAKSGFEMLSPGYPNWKKDIINATGLLGLEFDNAEYLNWYSPDDEPTDSGGERKKLFDLRRKSDVRHYRNSLARIQSSDAHSLAEFELNIDNMHLTRFKMDELSFEGFRTALVDPDARVRVLSTIPKSFPRILGMYITGGFLDQNVVHFSNNLNCFIGGRGAGKSTAIQSLAYALNKSEKIKSTDNCPHTIVVYAEDKNGVVYRYERQRGGGCLVQAYTREDRSINAVPPDSFKIEFYGQNDLSEVSQDPLNNPLILQKFLDEHINLLELLSKEKELVSNIQQLNGQIRPYQINQAGKPSKQSDLADVNTKLQIAEEGKIKEIAVAKTQLGAEKNLASEIRKISNGYALGLSLHNFQKNYDLLAQKCGTLTKNKKSKEILEQIKVAVLNVNNSLSIKQSELNVELKAVSVSLNSYLDELTLEHTALESNLSDKTIELQKQGLTGNVEELEILIAKKAQLVGEITKIENETYELNRLLALKNELLVELWQTRTKINETREKQLPSLNRNLSRVIDDYLVFLHYDKNGIIDDFKEYLLKIMQGDYFQDDMAQKFATATTPALFVDLLWKKNKHEIAKIAAIGNQWADKIFNKFFNYDYLYTLETMWKSPKPIITIKLKTTPPKEILINQLSDGQKHTILLTIAMLSDSSNPLIIDQPEDDLDNAYIFTSLVANLRQVKEMRQIILVTHNANIAVLGDAEQILPMFRNGENGQIKNSGSIDNVITKQTVQNVLEGGEIAFKKRMDIYGY